MEKLKNINEAISLLKEKEILTVTGKDQFLWKDEIIYRYERGNLFKLSLDDFIALYSSCDFYLFADFSNEIDQDKDEAYYRYYRK